MSDWPIVTEDDHGIRPAGGDDKCFYCKAVVGSPHAKDCVIVQKKIRVRHTIGIDVLVPHHWNEDRIDFHFNDGSWCADNLLADVKEYLGSIAGCLCGDHECEFVKVVDDNPTTDPRLHRVKDGCDE